MKEILDEYEVTDTGVIIDKATKKPLRIKKGVRDNKVTIHGVEYSVKDYDFSRVIEHEAEFMTDTPNNDFKGIEFLSKS